MATTKQEKQVSRELTAEKNKDSFLQRIGSGRIGKWSKAATAALMLGGSGGAIEKGMAEKYSAQITDNAPQEQKVASQKQESPFYKPENPSLTTVSMGQTTTASNVAAETEQSVQEKVTPNEESGISRRLNMLKMQAQQMVQQAKEYVKQQVKRVVVKVIMQVITAIISFIIANLPYIILGAIVLFVCLYVAYIVENPTEAITSLKSVTCVAGSIFGNNFDCWANAIFK